MVTIEGGKPATEDGKMTGDPARFNGGEMATASIRRGVAGRGAPPVGRCERQQVDS